MVGHSHHGASRIAGVAAGPAVEPATAGRVASDVSVTPVIIRGRGERPVSHP
jgi:hypothetical protein